MKKKSKEVVGRLVILKTHKKELARRAKFIKHAEKYGVTEK